MKYPSTNVIEPARINIRLTQASTGLSPIRYGWQEVARKPDGSWELLSRTGSVETDPAFEFNNLTAVIGNVYTAIRDGRTGQLLFF